MAGTLKLNAENSKSTDNQCNIASVKVRLELNLTVMQLSH